MAKRLIAVVLSVALLAACAREYRRSTRPARPPAHDTTATVASEPPLTTTGAVPPPPAPPPKSAMSKPPVATIFDAGAQSCPKCSVVNVYYATDRALSGDYSRGSRIFGTTRGKVRYGVASVSIPPWGSHKLGGLEEPRSIKLEVEWDPNKHVMLLGVDVDAESVWRKRLAHAVTASSGDALIFVHGFSVKFIDAARRTAQISHDLQFDGVPLMYTWPSDGELSIAAYRHDQREADASVANFKTFLVSLAQTPGIHKIHIIAHSMGNRLLTETLASLAADPQIMPKPRFNQIALTAPDVDSDVMRDLAGAIAGLSARTTLYASNKDRALQFSVQLNNKPRAGLSDHGVLVVPGFDSVDASAVDTNLVGHFYYAENRSVLNDIFYVIRGTPSEPPRFGMTPVGDGHARFWRFVP